MSPCATRTPTPIWSFNWGYTSVYYFRDGFIGWRVAGHPVDTVQPGDFIEGIVQ